MSPPVEIPKRNAGIEAANMVRDGMVVGLGTGSTVFYALKELSNRIRRDGLDIVGIPTSTRTEKLARRLKIPLSTLDEHTRLDLDIDGADEVDRDLNLIKGGGGAHVREKVVASASNVVAIVIDDSKLSSRLGEKCSVPVEVIPFAAAWASHEISLLGGKCRVRQREGRLGPFRTDNGNLILDCDFGPIAEPGVLEPKLKSIPGVVDSGIFFQVADIVIVGNRDGTRIMRRA